jgi:urea transport system permease protein
VSANVFDRLRALLLSVFLIATFALPAFAGPFEDAIAKFANDDFSDTDEAIGTVATSGNPLAFPIISALQDGRLSADPKSKKVFITQPDGKIVDAATGAAVASLRFASTTACAARWRQRLAA